MATKQEIIERLDFPALIQELIPSCRKAGAEFSGLCPFHDDQAASLSVNPVTGVFKCHACGAKGSIFDLFGKVHGLDFSASIKTLTARTGLASGKGNASNNKPKEVDRHDYHDVTGNLLYQRVRIEPGDNGRSKKYLPFDPSTEHWKRPCDPVLYHLPDVVNASTVIIFEGERKADVVKAWGLVGTCFDSGANSTITPAMIEALSGKHLVILPDQDESGRIYRDSIIKAMQGKAESIKVVDLPGLAVKGDIVDWIKIPGNGKERLLDLIQQAQEWEPVADDKPVCEPLKKLFMSYSDLMNEKIKIRKLVGKVIQRGCTCQVFGPSTAGKTFIAVDMALTIATGGLWNGIQCEQGIVIYFNGEGREGIKLRVRAWSKHHSAPDRADFHISTSAISFDVSGIQQVITEVEALEADTNNKVAFIVIDTLARHLIGDENSTRDMSEFIRAVDSLRDNFPDSTALIVHHTGNNVDAIGRSRGSSALKASVDVEMQVVSGVLTFTKMKDGPGPAPVEFKLMPVDLGTDEEGESVTSCIVKYGEKSFMNRQPEKAKLTKGELSVLHIITKNSGISVDAARAELIRQKTTFDQNASPNSIRKLFRESLETLVQKEIVFMEGQILTTGQKGLCGTFTEKVPPYEGTRRDYILKDSPESPVCLFSESVTEPAEIETKIEFASIPAPPLQIEEQGDNMQIPEIDW